MFHSEHLEELSKKLMSVIPIDLQKTEKNLKDQIKEVLQIGLGKLDLVTREEFDIQTKVLARTREKVEQLTEQLNTLKNEEVSKKPKK